MAAKRRRPSQCIQKSCPGKYKLSHVADVPIFTCNKCGHQDLSWQKFYHDYMELYKNKENWNNSKHHVACLLGFFMHMYCKRYGTPYILVPKNPNVFGSKEIKDTWELLGSFGGDANKARRYLYWLFKRGLNRNTEITHFGYVNTPGLIRKYNIYANKKHTLRRESKLPSKFVNWCQENEPNIFKQYNLETMNDLGALHAFANGSNDCGGQVHRVIEYAIKVGLIKNRKLNIGR